MTLQNCYYDLFTSQYAKPNIFVLNSSFRMISLRMVKVILIMGHLCLERPPV